MEIKKYLPSVIIMVFASALLYLYAGDYSSGGSGKSAASLREGPANVESGSIAAPSDEKVVYDDAVKNNADIFNDHSLLYSYVKKFGVAAALNQLFSLEAKYVNCHEPAHYVGRYAYEIYDIKAFGECAMLCQSGCYHGAVEAFFKEHGTANLEKNLNEMCADLTNLFIKHQCLHGMGHGLLAWSSYQLFEALESCELLKVVSDRDSCFTGVFMENVVQAMAKFLGLAGHITDYLKDDDPHYPCDIVSQKYQPTCYFLQTDHMAKIFGGDFSKVASSCAEVEYEHARRSCFESTGRTVGSYNRKNPAGAIRDCSKIPAEDMRNLCFRGAVQDSFWDPSGKDLAIKFCRLLADVSAKGTCYQTIFERASQVFSTAKELKEFCSSVEEKYQKQCPGQTY